MGSDKVRALRSDLIRYNEDTGLHYSMIWLNEVLWVLCCTLDWNKSSSRSQLPVVCHPAASPRLHPVDHHSLWLERDHLHHHNPLQRCALCFQGLDHHLQGLQQAITCHRPGAAPGQRYSPDFRISLYPPVWICRFIKYHLCDTFFLLLLLLKVPT